MGVKDRRANIKHGRYSRALVLPAAIEKGNESTLAANRLILVDPRGQISEEDHIEPHFWFWYHKKREEIDKEASAVE